MTGHKGNYPGEPDSEAEWEAGWTEFERIARQIGWPEELIRAYLDGRVSWQERQESLRAIKRLWEDGKYREALFEDKRTMMRRPATPEDWGELPRLVKGSEKDDK